MYNIDMYQYQDKPFVKMGTHQIYPWNDQGKEKYFLGNDSHNKCYLNKMNPVVFKEIVGEEYEEYVKKENTFKNERSIEEAKVSEIENYNNSVNNVGNAGTNISECVKINKSQSQNNLHSNAINHLIPRDIRPERKNILIKRLKHNSSFNHGKPWNDNMKLRKEDESLHGEISKLNKSLSVSNVKKIFVAPNSFLQNSQNFFTSKTVPHTTIYHEKKEPSIRFKNYTSRLASSWINNWQSDYQKNIEQNLQKQNHNWKSLLDVQMDKRFLSVQKLPSILNIGKSQKIIQTTKLGKHTFMGEKYNPYSFIYKDKNNNALRNYVGGKYSN